MSLLLLGGCVSQKDYDAVVAERSAAQTQVASLQSELGNAQSRIKTLESDLSGAQGQIKTLESNLTEAQGKIDSLKADLSKAEAQSKTLQSDLDGARAKYKAFKSDLNTLWTSLENKLNAGGMIIQYWNGAAKLEAGVISEAEYTDFVASFMASTGTYISAAGNAELSQLWQDFFTYATQDKQTEMLASLARLTDLLLDLIGEDIEALEAKLSE